MFKKIKNLLKKKTQELPNINTPRNYIFEKGTYVYCKLGEDEDFGIIDTVINEDYYVVELTQKYKGKWAFIPKENVMQAGKC